jgi:hypothetical protein
MVAVRVLRIDRPSHGALTAAGASAKIVKTNAPDDRTRFLDFWTYGRTRPEPRVAMNRKSEVSFSLLAGADLASRMGCSRSGGDALDVISRDVGFTDAMRMRSAFCRTFGFSSREMPQCALTSLKVVD